MQKLTPHYDMEAFLATFECMAEKGVASGTMGQPHFSIPFGVEPQKVYDNLPAADTRDYAKLKGEIIAHLGVTITVRAHALLEVLCWPVTAVPTALTVTTSQ